MIINYSHPYDNDTDANAWVCLYLKRIPLTLLLKLHVNIPSWTYYGSNKTEEEIYINSKFFMTEIYFKPIYNPQSKYNVNWKYLSYY